MTQYIPIKRASLLDSLDDKEVLEGYIDGSKNEPEPKGNRSVSYWHGWRNGMVDYGHKERDDAQTELAKDAIESGYLKELIP